MVRPSAVTPRTSSQSGWSAAQPGPGRVAQCHVMQAGHAVGLGRPAGRLPGVEAEVVVVAAGGQEEDVAGAAPAGDVAPLRHDVEAEHADIEVAHAVDVGRAQVDVADRHAGVDGVRGGGDGGDVALQGGGGHGSPSTELIADATIRRRAGRRRPAESHAARPRAVLLADLLR